MRFIKKMVNDNVYIPSFAPIYVAYQLLKWETEPIEKMILTGGRTVAEKRS